MAIESPPSNKRILLVEDNQGDVRLFELVLQNSSLNVKLEHRWNGDEALDFLEDRTEDHRVDVVILDLNLPRTDGFEVLKRLKSDPSLATIPVLVFTSSDAEVDIQRALDLQADAYIVKGANLAEFRRRVIDNLTAWLSPPPPALFAR